MADVREQEHLALALAGLPNREQRGAVMRVIRSDYGDERAQAVRQRALKIMADRRPSRLPPATRGPGPSTSAAAEAEITDSGAREHQMQIVVALVQAKPGLTTREYAALSPDLDLYMIRRRMSDAKEPGLVVAGESRKCRISNRTVLTWWPAATESGK